MANHAKNREDYRSMSTRELLEAVTYEVNPDWREMAIALAERLRNKNSELQDYRYATTADREGY